MAGIDLNAPVSPAPKGFVQNLDNPPNQAVLAYTTLSLAFTFATLFAWSRILIKLRLRNKLFVEDYLIMVAWVAATADVACGYKIYSFAPILHAWDMSRLHLSKYLMWFRISSIFYNISIVCIKVAVLIHIRRIFAPRGTQPRTYFVINIMIGAQVVFYTIIALLMLFNCRPIHKAWTPWIPGKCITIGVIAMNMAVFNLIGDLAILFLSQKVIWTLMRVERKKRWMLSIVFLAGIVPCGFAVMCLIYNRKLSNTNDFTRTSMYMSIACYWEIASGLFVLFLPVVPKFVSDLKKNYSFRTLSSKASKKPSSAFSDGGHEAASGGRGRNKSFNHITYTEKGSEEKFTMTDLTEVSVSVKSDYAEEDPNSLEMAATRREVV